MWSRDLILELLTRTLRDQEHRLREEQAVNGLDRLSEVALHAVLARGAEAAGLGAFREVVYPCAPVPRSRLTERQRCDLVLTPSPLTPPLDPEEAHRAAAVSAGTLFEHSAPPVLEPGCPPEHGFWLEMKVVGQFAFNRGVPMPNAAYSSEISAGIAADHRKLAADALIRHGAAALVLFNSDADTARHDIRALAERSARRGIPGPLIHADFAILDRIGNRTCSVVVAPVK